MPRGSAMPHLQAAPDDVAYEEAQQLLDDSTGHGHVVALELVSQVLQRGGVGLPIHTSIQFSESDFLSFT